MTKMEIMWFLGGVGMGLNLAMLLDLLGQYFGGKARKSKFKK